MRKGILLAFVVLTASADLLQSSAAHAMGAGQSQALRSALRTVSLVEAVYCKHPPCWPTTKVLVRRMDDLLERSENRAWVGQPEGLSGKFSKFGIKTKGDLVEKLNAIGIYNIESVFFGPPGQIRITRKK
jgi:hypothetical protein